MFRRSVAPSAANSSVLGPTVAVLGSTVAVLGCQLHLVFRQLTLQLALQLTPFVVFLPACASVNLNNAERLIQNHAVGFRDAVRASTNSVVFVRGALKTINRLESALERQ